MATPVPDFEMTTLTSAGSFPATTPAGLPVTVRIHADVAEILFLVYGGTDPFGTAGLLTQRRVPSDFRRDSAVVAREWLAAPGNLDALLADADATAATYACMDANRRTGTGG